MTLLKNNEAREAIPSYLKPLVQEHFALFNGALLVADTAMMVLHGRRLITDERVVITAQVSVADGITDDRPPPKAEHTSFWYKAEPYGDYKDDGNTKTAGTRHRFLWVYELVGRGPEKAYQNGYMDWYQGRLINAIAHEFEVQTRDSDRRERAGGATLTFGGAGIGPDADHDEKNIRIAYATSGNTCHIGAYAIANLIERVVKLRERLALVRTVERFIPEMNR